LAFEPLLALLRQAGRSDSAACAVFFTRDPVPIEEPPERTFLGPYATLSQLHFDFGKGNIRRRFVKPKDGDGMGVDVFRTMIAALLVGSNDPSVAELLMPENSTGLLTPNRSAASRRQSHSQHAGTG
jgi:hypothetical protein